MQTLYADHLLTALTRYLDGKLHQRLFKVLQQAMINGTFPPASRLPASRDLAKELKVSRNTVVNAYEQLMAEGYVTARTGSGTWVCDRLPEYYLNSRLPVPLPVRTRCLPDAFSQRGADLLGYAGISPHQSGAFVPGIPDVTAFPHPLFNRILARIQANPTEQDLTYNQWGGCLALRRALSHYLKITRSVNAKPHQIIITTGTHQSVDLLSRLLADQGDIAWLEEPGYFGTRNILRLNGLQVQGIAVDRQGMVIKPHGTPQPKLVFITPSHQYPLGMSLSCHRRKMLLNQARQQGFWIIEDDYDSEFRYTDHPLPALQSMQTTSPVMYMGTFSKTLYPTLRLGYLVVPETLSQAFNQAAAELFIGGSFLLQRAVAEFIQQGHYAAHIRRVRLLYQQRRQYLLGLIERYLGPRFLPFDPHDAGLHLVIPLPDESDDVSLCRHAWHAGVIVRPLSHYYQSRQKKRGLLLGFASVNEPEIFRAFTLLRQCLITAGISSPGSESTLTNDDHAKPS